MDLARKRLGGNMELLRRLLKDFAGAYNDADRQMATLISEGDAAAGMALAHTIKGVAANLGAQPLAEAAQALEADLRDDKNPAAPLADFSHALSVALESIGRLGEWPENRSSSSDPGDACPPGPEWNRQLALELDGELDGLARLIGKNSARAEDAAAAISGRLPSGPLAEAMDQLGAKIRGFDFRGAKALLADIRRGVDAAILACPDPSGDQDSDPGESSR